MVLEAAELIALVQIDATVIAGILILLTVTKLYSLDEPIPHKIAWIVVPFGIAAILSLSAMGMGKILVHLSYISVIAMILGFIYLIILMIDFTKSKEKKT